MLITAGGAFAQEQIPIVKIDPNSGHYAVGKGIDRDTLAAMAAVRPLTFAPLTTWNGKFTTNSVDYPFTMVGTDPAMGSQTTTVKALIVPLIFKFPGRTTISSTKRVGCGGTSSALKLVKNSPIFQNADYNLDGTDVGTTQYTDAFQRANFWTTVSGSAPDYHVLLKPVVAAPITVRVPLASAALAAGPCGNVGLADIGWFDLIEVPKLLARIGQIKPNLLPIFLTYDVTFFEGNPLNCCILGYHNSTTTKKGVQTYSVSGFFDSTIFNGVDDVVPLGHEVAEWMDDPLVSNSSNGNSTPAWGHIGQVSGCQSNLEVGDPLSGTEFTEMNSAFPYHVQDLAFVPWFAQANSSFSVNGWFSFFGTFLSAAAPCS